MKKLLQAIASLESKIDILETENSLVNQMLKECGLPEGIQSLKTSVQEILQKKADNPS
jgi:prefoldin subunit 5